MKEEALLPDVSECISKFKLTFKNVIDSEIEALFVDTIIKFHKKGDYIYNEGARIKGCYFLFSGIAKIFQTTIQDETHQTLRTGHDERRNSQSEHREYDSSVQSHIPPFQRQGGTS